jgi:hypothetical protein
MVQGNTLQPITKSKRNKNIIEVHKKLEQLLPVDTCLKNHQMLLVNKDKKNPTK